IVASHAREIATPGQETGSIITIVVLDGVALIGNRAFVVIETNFGEKRRATLVIAWRLTLRSVTYIFRRGQADDSFVRVSSSQIVDTAARLRVEVRQLNHREAQPKTWTGPATVFIKIQIGMIRRSRTRPDGG